MSQWEHNPEKPSSSSPVLGATTSEEIGLPSSPPAEPSTESSVQKTLPGWVRGLPYFLSALLFLSGFFSFFAPLPLVLLGLGQKKWGAWLAAAVTNSAIVFFLGGLAYFAAFSMLVLTTGLALPLFLSRGWSISRVAVSTLGAIFGVLATWLIALAAVYKTNPISWLVGHGTVFLDQLLASLAEETRTNLLGDFTAKEWQTSLFQEMPSGIAIFCLLVVTLNLLLVLRINPNGIRESRGLDAYFFRRWKSPDFLVWPTLILGFGVVLDLGPVSVVALNGFKFLMAVYAIQGLSILSFIFDVWKLRGGMRGAAFLLVIFAMMPLVLSLGFFDLWFDFRAKLRQS